MVPNLVAGSEVSGSPTRRADLPFLAACLTAAALLCGIAYPVLTWWYWEYTRPNSHYAHAFFVPALSAVMLWHLRQPLGQLPKQMAPAALALLLPALALLVFAQKSDMQALMSWSFLLTIVAAAWFVAGRAFVQTAAFPLGFLWLMAPLPGPLLNDLTLKMQMFSLVAATKLLGLLGFAPVRNGNIIQMEHYTMNVDVPCSGFQLLLRLLTFCLAFAYLTDGPKSRRVGLFLFSLPLSLAINAIRITSIGIVGERLGERAAHQFHDAGGILSLVLCMAVLFGFAKAMGCKTFAGQPIF